MVKAAQVVGTVEYRDGDGPAKQIRKGTVEVETAGADATLSWEDDTPDGQARSSAALPLADFQRYVDEGAIRVDGEGSEGQDAKD